MVAGASYFLRVRSSPASTTASPETAVDRARYVESLGVATAPGGRYYMLCFSDRQPGDWGPRRVTEAEIRASFTTGWQIESIEPAKFSITISPEGAFAWRAAMTRT